MALLDPRLLIKKLEETSLELAVWVRVAQTLREDAQVTQKLSTEQGDRARQRTGWRAGELDSHEAELQQIEQRLVRSYELSKQDRQDLERTHKEVQMALTAVDDICRACQEHLRIAQKQLEQDRRELRAVRDAYQRAQQEHVDARRALQVAEQSLIVCRNVADKRSCKKEEAAVALAKTRIAAALHAIQQAEGVIPQVEEQVRRSEQVVAQWKRAQEHARQAGDAAKKTREEARIGESFFSRSLEHYQAAQKALSGARGAFEKEAEAVTQMQTETNKAHNFIEDGARYLRYIEDHEEKIQQYAHHIEWALQDYIHILIALNRPTLQQEEVP